jgi:hypothetical protein
MAGTVTTRAEIPLDGRAWDTRPGVGDSGTWAAPVHASARGVRPGVEVHPSHLLLGRCLSIIPARNKRRESKLRDTY